MDTKYTPGPWSINSDGEYCGARIDGPNGRSVAHAIQRDPHPTLGMGIAQDEAIANARRIVACVNACSGSSTDWLDFIVSEEYSDEFGGPVPFETRHGEILRMSLGFMVERDQRKKQRDELLEALEIMIIGACAVGVPHQGERKVLQDAVDHARAAIAKATGKEA